jgi:hypothetical protein
MSLLGQWQPITTFPRTSAVPLNSRRDFVSPSRAGMCQYRKSSIDQFVCSREQGRRHGETESFGSFEVDD